MKLRHDEDNVRIQELLRRLRFMHGDPDRFMAACMGYKMRCSVTHIEHQARLYQGSVQTEDGQIFTAEHIAKYGEYDGLAQLQSQIGHQLRLQGKRGKDFE